MPLFLSLIHLSLQKPLPISPLLSSKVAIAVNSHPSQFSKVVATVKLRHFMVQIRMPKARWL